MKNVIIVGANGFLGSNLTKRLIEQNINVYAVVNQSIDRVDAINSPRLNIVRSLDELCNFEVDYYDALYYFAWMGNSGSERGDLLLQQENIMARRSDEHSGGNAGQPGQGAEKPAQEQGRHAGKNHQVCQDRIRRDLIIKPAG